jgi:hypothetical protein
LFFLHQKMCISSFAPSIKRQVTVRLKLTPKLWVICMEKFLFKLLAPKIWSSFRFFENTLGFDLNYKEGNFTRNCESRQWQRTENIVSIFNDLKQCIPVSLYKPKQSIYNVFNTNAYLLRSIKQPVVSLNVHHHATFQEICTSK